MKSLKHLKNARYIEYVLTHPELYQIGHLDEWYDRFSNKFSIEMDDFILINREMHDLYFHVRHDQGLNVSMNAMVGTLIALSTYDDAPAFMRNSSSEAEFLAMLGQPVAILMLPGLITAEAAGVYRHASMG